MSCRSYNLESDIDNVLHEKLDLKKFMLTKNCKKETALRWALQRAKTKEDRDRIQAQFKELVESGENLI